MLSVQRVIGHREWAPGRKSDPRYDMNWRRAGVAGVEPRRPGGFLMALNDDEQRELLEGVRDIRGLRMDGFPPDARHPGGIANAVISLWAQTFFGSKDFGPPLVKRAAPDPAAIAAAVAEEIKKHPLAEQIVAELVRQLPPPATGSETPS